MLKSDDEAWALFENLSSNSIHHASTRHRAPTPKAPKAVDLFEVGHSDVAIQVVEAATRKLDQFIVTGLAPNSTHLHTKPEPFSFCSSPMDHVNDCTTAEIMLIFLMSTSMRLSHNWVMICIPIPTTRGGEIKLNPIGSPTNLLPHIDLHNNNTRPQHLLNQSITLRIGFCK